MREVGCDKFPTVSAASSSLLSLLLRLVLSLPILIDADLHRRCRSACRFAASSRISRICNFIADKATYAHSRLRDNHPRRSPSSAYADISTVCYRCAVELRVALTISTDTMFNSCSKTNNTCARDKNKDLGCSLEESRDVLNICCDLIIPARAFNHS